MLKGKTTIQLFDKETGKMTDEVIKHNLVTNAVKNVLGGVFNKLAFNGNVTSVLQSSGFAALYSLPSSKNFAQTFFGGVLIFSKAITEDVNHIIPSVDEINSCIGCGNQSAGILGNTYKGSLNSSESVVTDNTVTFVWDFSTEQCNGDIASICLTSDLGGVLGWGYDSVADELSNVVGRGIRNFKDSSIWDIKVTHTINTYVTGHAPLVTSAYASSNEGRAVYVDSGYLYYIYRGTAYKQSISDITGSGLSLALTTGLDWGRTLSYETIATTVAYTDIFYSGLNSAYCVDTLNTDNLILVKYSGNANAETIIIPLTNLVVSLKEYYGVSSISYYSFKNRVVDMAVHNDKVYFICGSFNATNLDTDPNRCRIYVINFDGTFTYKDVTMTDRFIKLFAGTAKVGISATSAFDGDYFVFDTALAYCSPEHNNCFIIDDDGTMHTAAFLCEYHMGSYTKQLLRIPTIMPEPYISGVLAGTDMQCMYTTELISGYLATINNQETILTKTPDKTMKITYTLTQNKEA